MRPIVHALTRMMHPPRHDCTHPALTRRAGLSVVVLLAFMATPLMAQNTAPVAASQDLTAVPGQVLSITLTATDADSDPLAFIITAIPTGGIVTADSADLTAADLPKTLVSATISFAAAADASGNQVIQFKASDAAAESPVAKVTIDVNSAPAGVDTTFFTEPNTSLKFTLPAEDFDNDALTYTILSLPGHGRLQTGTTILSDNDLPFVTTTKDVTYDPDPDFHGGDDFTFTAADDLTTTPTLTADIEVNTTPVPEDLLLTVTPDGTLAVTLVGDDADKDPVRFAILSVPAHGTLTDGGLPIAEQALPYTLAVGQTSVDYLVQAGFAGSDSFHYRVQDSVSQSDRAIVSITVNAPPIASGTSSTTVDDLGAATLLLQPIDADGDDLTVHITALPQQGSISVDGTDVVDTTTEFDVDGEDLTVVYTADEDASGTDTFQWVANDGRDDSAIATVTITLTPDEPEPEPEPDPGDSDDEDNGDDSEADDDSDAGDDSSSSGDDEVLGDSPEDEPVPAPGCGTTGTAETAATAMFFGGALFGNAFRRRRCNGRGH